MAHHDASDLAQRLGRNAEAVCREYLSNGRREGRYWLVGDVRNTPGRSMYVRLQRCRLRQGRGGQMDRRGHRRTWRSARRHPRSLGLIDFKDVAEEARRFLSLPRPEPDIQPKPRPSSAKAGSPESARRLFAILATDYGHCRGGVFAQTRHYGFARNRSPALPSTLLLSPGPAFADRDLAGDDRIGHRSEADIRPAHTAPGSPRWLEKGADRHAEAGDGRSPRARGTVRRGGRCDDGGRRHRDHAVAADGFARFTSVGGALGRTSRRHRFPDDTAPTLYRPRRRSGRGRCYDDLDRTCGNGRDRGDCPFVSPGGLQRRSAHRSAAMRYGPPCGFRSHRTMSRGSWRIRHWPGWRCEGPSVAGVSLRRRVLPFHVGEGRDHGLLRGRPGRQTARSGNGCARFFSAGGPPPHEVVLRGDPGCAAFASRSKTTGLRHPPLRFGRPLRSRCRTAPPAVFRRHEGRGGRGRSDEGASHDHRP